MSPGLTEIADEDADVLVERRGGVAVLTLNRPEKMNALLITMVEQLRASLEEAEADEGIRAAVLTGAGRGYCAGADLEVADPDVRKVLREHYSPLIDTIGAIELPVITAINGTAAGVGISLALAGDVAIGAAGAQFVLAFTRVGLIPDGGMTWILPRLVGRARAFELMALGDRFDAERALELGLLSRVVAPEQVLDEALALAERFAAGPRAIGLVKQAVRASLEQGLAPQLDLEAELQREAVASADFTEALAAFREKRDPTFRGR